MRAVLIIALSLVVFSAQAENLGVYGQVYPVTEPDLLSFIHQRLDQMEDDGEMIKMQQKFKRAVTEHTLRPAPVKGVGIATKPRIHYYDPTFRLNRNIYDSKGNLLVASGSTVNPFDYMSLKEVLLFINADDPTQVSWAKAEKSQFDFTKIILVKGNIKSASTDDHLGRIYFDQSGVLCKKFNITQVPALVRQNGKRLEIDEVPVNTVISGETKIRGY